MSASEDAGSPEAGIPGACEPPSVGAGNGTSVLLQKH